MLIFHVIFCFFLISETINASSDFNFNDFKLSDSGKIEVEKQMKKMFEKKIFIVKEDLELNIGNDILPWKLSDISKLETRKRRGLRKIIDFLKKTHLEGLHTGFTEKMIKFDGESGIYCKFNIDGENVVAQIPRTSAANKKNVERGWIVMKFNGEKVKPHEEFDELVDDSIQNKMSYTITFGQRLTKTEEC